MTPEESAARIAIAEVLAPLAAVMREATAAALDRGASNRALLAVLETLHESMNAIYERLAQRLAPEPLEPPRKPQ